MSVCGGTSCGRLHACVCVCVCVCMCVFVSLYVYACMCIGLHVCACICVHIHKNIYECIPMLGVCIHTYTHTYNTKHLMHLYTKKLLKMCANTHNLKHTFIDVRIRVSTYVCVYVM